MSLDELSLIKEEASNFLLKNKRKYHIYKLTHQRMKDLTKETYQDTLKFVNDNLDIFLADHSSAINFFGFIKNSISSNIRHLELIFDIVIHFIDEFKRLNVTENEMFSICIQYINYINYLFQKKIISISTIIEQSYQYPVLFINFLPEIREYDSEYAQLREKTFFQSIFGPLRESLTELLKSVNKDPQQHIKNREINYHPSTLHKSIREDDIDTFQSLLSKNSIDINHRIEYSFYERTQPHETSTSLIQTATIYGAQKIIKFLLLQPNLILDDNLVSYAYFSYDLNLIHYYEQKGCSLDNITYMPIYMHQKDILNYYIENFSDHISESNHEVKNAVQNLFDDDNSYNLLSYQDLQYPLLAYNYSIIKKVLPKIAFIVKKVELNHSKLCNIFSKYSNFLLISAGYQFDIFRFLCSQDEQSLDCYYFTAVECLRRNMNDAFKFLFSKISDNEYYLHLLLETSIVSNHDMANYLLDLQIKEMDENVHKNENSLYSKFSNIITFPIFILAIKNYNEDIIVKMFKLYHSIIENQNLLSLVSGMTKFLSNRMIFNLFDKIPFLYNNDDLLLLLESIKLYELAKFVKERREKEPNK